MRGSKSIETTNPQSPTKSPKADRQRRQEQDQRLHSSDPTNIYYFYCVAALGAVISFVVIILSSQNIIVFGRRTFGGIVTTDNKRSSRFFSFYSFFSRPSSPSPTTSFIKRIANPTTTPIAAAPTTATMTTTASTNAMWKKEDPTLYKLIDKKRLSPDSFWLRYELPVVAGSEQKDDTSTEQSSPLLPILGYDPYIPTCIKIDYPNGTNVKTGEYPVTLSKSYSPVSHPCTTNHFDLIVKSYDERPGGGVGKYICDMDVGQSIVASLKAQRIMHGSPHVIHRGWKHIGLVAGGTGIAPLLQIAKIALGDNTTDDYSSSNNNNSPDQTIVEHEDDVQVHLLFINRNECDILGQSEIDTMVQRYPNQFHVTYALTNYSSSEDDDTQQKKPYLIGRGDVEMARAALPPPSTNGKSDTMIFVCGKDGFVEHWGGPVGRGPPPPGKKKGPKIQGPLLGVLADVGYTADQVFKY